MTTSNPFHNFGLEGILVPGSNKGLIIYVDTAANGGDDGNSGLRIGEAKLTIHGALAICTDYMWDTIVVLNHDNSEAIEFPIAVDVHGVRIVGAPGGGYHPRYTGGQIIQPTTDLAGISIEANHVQIRALEFRAGATHGGIEFVTTGTSRHGIYDCVFQSGLYGIWATAASAPSAAGPTIKNCYFRSSITSDGIRFHSNSAFASVEKCTFDSVGGIAINVTGANTTAMSILNNRIGLLTSDAAKAIVISGQQAWRCIIDGNIAMFSEVEMDANPYLDTSAPTGAAPQCNHWMRNYRGMTPIYPAVGPQ